MKSCKPHEKTKQKLQNAKSNDEKLKTKGLMFFVSFFSCDLQDFKFQYVNNKALGKSFLNWIDFTGVIKYTSAQRRSYWLNFLSNFFVRPWDANFPEQLNADFTIKLLMRLGAPAKKLVLGIPTYGRGFSVQANSNMKPPLPANGGSTAGPITREAGYLG